MVESYHIERTERSHLGTKSHVSHDQETRKLQQEVDCLRRKLRCRSVIEGVHLSHQVRVQGEAGIAYIGIGLELHLVSSIRLLHARTSWRKVITNVKRGILIIP